MLTRPQMFTSNGHREEQEQRLALGATRDGRAHRDPPREALAHLAVRRLGRARDRRLLAALRLRQLPRRAPADPRQHDDADVHPRPRRGARRVRCSRCAMDELASRARRSTRSSCGCATTRRSTRTATRGRATAWRSACARGAERFGWADRDPAPRSRRDGDWLIGTGMAAAGYPVAFFMPEQRARARIYADGSAVVQTGDAGVRHRRADDGDAGRAPTPSASTWRAMTFQAGDTDLPNSTAAVGSAGAGMVSAAVHAAGTRAARPARRAGDRRRRLAAARRRRRVRVGRGAAG